MTIDHWAVPITSIEGKLLGIEIESHVESEGVRLLAGMEEEVLSSQLSLIESKAAWFRDNDLYCLVSKGSISTTEYLPFLRQMTTTTRTHEHEWLDDVGVYSGSAIPLVTGDFEVARLNRRYTEENISRLIFPVLIKSIRQYCDKVIIPVKDKTYHQMLKAAGVWAVQGDLYRSVPFHKVNSLL